MLTDIYKCFEEDTLLEDFEAFLDSLDCLPEEQDNLYIDKKGTLFERIHANSKGKISVAFKNENTQEWIERYDTYDNLRIGLFNNFFSINTFTGRRELKNLFELKANFIELDIEKNTKYTKEQVLFFLEEDVFGHDVPTPTLIVDSGHGFWLLWLYEDLAICRKGKAFNVQMYNKWNLIQDYLYNSLKDFGADRASLDAARVMRCTRTINWKKSEGLAPRFVKVVRDYKVMWTMEDLFTEITGLTKHEFRDFIEKKKTSKSKIKRNTKSNWNIKLTTVNRIKDLEKLLELRNFDVRGLREIFLFLYAYFTLCLTKDADYTTERVLAINNRFVEPLPEKQVLQEALKGAITGFKNRLSINSKGRGGYNYKTETLIELLDISEAEQQFMTTLCSDTVKEERKLANERRKRRNNNGLTLREQSKLNNIFICHCLKERGYTNKEIVELTSLSKGTVSKYLSQPKPDESLVDIDFINEYFSVA